MPKNKNPIIQKKKDYLYVAIGIATSILCILLIGRVGIAGSKIALIFSFILGDFSTLILAAVLVYSICYILFKKKMDFHHISFIGSLFIYIAFSMFAHLGLYEALNMTNKTVFTKTLDLYQNYLKSYDITYSCGGGIIGALFVQLSCFLLGKVGTILLGICFILIGVSFFANIKFLKIFKGGKITKIPKRLIASAKNYIENIHYPGVHSEKPLKKKVSLSLLEDHEEQVSFTLQNEINKEKFEEFRRFIKERKIYCVADCFHTSYSSSRIDLKFAHRSEDEMKQMIGFFNRNCFFLKNDQTYSLELPNQFRKLLTLKSLLLTTKKDASIPIAVDVDGKVIELDMSEGRLIVVLGDRSSGVKTFLRSFLVSLAVKNLDYSEIYFYDFFNDFSVLNGSCIKYVNNERSAGIALDEAFSEYERRSEVLKYLDCDSIQEVNDKIKKTNQDISLIYPEFHFFYLDLSLISTTLLQKISYAIRFAVRVGIHIILCCRGKNELAKIDLNHSDIIAFSTADVTTSLKLFGTDMACRLQKKGDVLIQTGNRLYHGQAPYVSTKNFDTIIHKY